MQGEKILILSVLCCLLIPRSFAQSVVTLADGSVKIGIMGEEIFYFGFSKGDKLIFSFDMVTGKELKELEISTIPDNNSRFRQLKPSKIINQIISIPATEIYKFRFTSSSVLPRTISYKIQRLPASTEMQQFNSTVYTETFYDTSYITEIENFIVKDTVYNTFRERGIKLNPASSAGNNKASFNFILPENIIAWSYYITSGLEGLKIYDDANKKFLSESGAILSKHPLYNILVAIALKSSVTIPKLKTGKEISYWIMDEENAKLFESGSAFKFIKYGKAINEFTSMDARKGALYFGLLNEDTKEAQNITVKIVTVLINESLRSRQNQKMVVNPVNKMVLKN